MEHTGRVAPSPSGLWPWLLAAAAVAVLHLTASPAGAAFAYRKNVRVSPGQVTGGPLAHFPLLFSTIDPDFRTTANGGKVVSGTGDDIVFRALDDTTCGGPGTSPCQLDHEIDKYVGTTGELIAWVRVPSIDNGTRIYIDFGDASVITPTENPTGVWDANFRGVWHLEEPPAGPFVDSTSNPNDATVAVNPPFQVAGQVGSATAFEWEFGLDRHLVVADHPSLRLPTHMTISAWFRTMDNTTQNRVLLAKWGGTGSGWQNYFLGKMSNTSLGFVVDGGAAQSVTTPWTPGLRDGNWHHVVGVADASAPILRLYVDGAQVATSPYDGTSETGNSVLHFSDNPGSALQWWEGGIDESRVSSTPRSADWIATEYRNQSAPSAFYVVCENFCGTLSTTDVGGAVTVTAAGAFKLRFNTATGGAIDQFFDLAADPTETYDLAGDDPSSSRHRALFVDEIYVNSVPSFYFTTADNGRAELLEATPTRVKVRQESPFQDGGSNNLAGIKALGDYSIYPAGRIGLRWRRRTTAAVTSDGQELQLLVRDDGAPPLNAWTAYSQGGPLSPFIPGNSNFLLVKNEQAQVQTDFLQILFQDWAPTNRTGSNVVAGFRQTFWQDTDVGVPVTDEDVSSVIYFKPTGFVDHLDPGVTDRRDDYRFPDALSIMVGSNWNHASENTASDYFNEFEAAYPLTLDPSLGLRFEIDGSAASRRYQPFFKIRQWRSFTDPSVTFEGTALTNDADFRADVKPISRAHFAQDLLWYSTMQDPASAWLSPDVGNPGSALGTNFVPARYGGGIEMLFAGEYHSLPTTDFDPSRGAIEFWFRPYYNSADGAEHNLAGFRTNPNNQWILQKAADNNLYFMVTASGQLSQLVVSSASYRWLANDWVHVRMEWDDTAPVATQLRLLLSGVEPNPGGGTGADYIGAALSLAPNFLIGNYRTGGGAPGSFGVYDELYSYGGSSTTPAPLAHGGLTTDSREYLASQTANFSLFFAAVDAQRKGEYLFIGSDSQFRGLNVSLIADGVGTAPTLQWQFWNGTAWVDLIGFGLTDETQNLRRSGTLYWTGDPFNWAPYSVNGGPDLYYVRSHLVSGDYASQTPVESLIKTDILLFQFCRDITDPAQEFLFAVPTPTTAVELTHFSARALDSEVELTWQTASELNNLGFHLYRALSAEGAYERITGTAIPGLGSSPAGARYRYVDSGLDNGTTYFYRLEDIETTGSTEWHGPVSATPEAGETQAISPASPVISYSNPSGSSFQVVRRTRTELLLELRTEGFEATLEEDGSLRLAIPGFEVDSEPGSPELPVKRSWVEVEPGLRLSLGSVRVEEIERFSSLRPSATQSAELIASRRGTVRAGKRAQREGAAFRGTGLYPEEPVRLLGVGYQGEVKKALLSFSPLRWNRTTGELVLARRLVVRLVFSGREESTHRETTSHRQKTAPVRLVAREKGLYGVRFADVRGIGAIGADSLRLSQQGETVAFHIEPDNGTFGPGSTLYFLSEGASLNPYGHEAVYELERGGGVRMSRGSASPSGEAVGVYWQRVEREENRYYQAGLLDAEDLWLWDLLLAPVEKSYPFELDALAVTTAASRLRLWLQGVSDFEVSPDHHLRVRLNGIAIAEASFEGKRPLRLDAEVPPGALREGQNLISIENVGDTAASYSMVMLDRFQVDYPRRLVAEGGMLSGEFRESGAAQIAGVSSDALSLDVTEEPARWLTGARPGAEALELGVERGRRYLVLSSKAVKKPEIQWPRPSRLKNERNRADYLVLGPRQFLEVAGPLVELRRRQGLATRAVSLEEIYSEFGHGESRPEAIHEFLSYAYHHFRKPAPRYVVLLGDATYDFKDYLGTGVKNQLPPLTVKTSYLWTASDPAYAAVHGEDPLPDLAIGRLPAASADELRVMVEKLVAYEANGSLGAGATVLVADNPDAAGDFERDSEEIASTLLASRNPRRIYLSELGVEATRRAVEEAFDGGASLLSYAGHGGIHLWAQENIFQSEQVAGLAPQSAQPLVLTLNCLNGYFHFPYFNALSEELLKAEGKGAIATFSPSGLSLNQPAHLFHKALVSELVSGNHARLGDAVLAAQAAYSTTGAFPELLSIYHLLGDPATSLR